MPGSSDFERAVVPVSALVRVGVHRPDRRYRGWWVDAGGDETDC